MSESSEDFKLEVDDDPVKDEANADVEVNKIEEKVDTEPKPEEVTEKPVTSTPAKKQKADKPCDKFRLDTAGEFGTCFYCGWKKADHGKKNDNVAAKMLSNLKAKNSSISAGDDAYNVDGGDGECTVFKLDTTAAEFGVCKTCGRKRGDHKAKASNKAQLALERLRSSNADKWRAGSNGGEGPCDVYKTDTAAKEFGVCVYCGYKRADHEAKEKNAAALLLENLKKKNEEKRAQEEAAAQQEALKEMQEEAAEPEDPVETLDKEETKAEQKPEKKKKGKGKKCVIC